MASNCKACSDLREYAPEFVTNGVTENVSKHLENNNGLGANDGHTDCGDLHDAVDCLVGNMDDQLEAYEVCDWKKFMHKFIPNVHNTVKAVISSICGLWYNICRLWCFIDEIINGSVNIKVTEAAEKNDTAYMVAGNGVSFLLPSGAEAHTSDWRVQSYGTNLLRIYGSLKFFTKKFDDASSCLYFTPKGDTPVKGKNDRPGEDKWETKNLYQSYGVLALEIRINKKKFPQLKHIAPGNGFDTGGGAYHCYFAVFDSTEGDKYAYGMYGHCDPKTGKPESEDESPGHTIEDGWVYIQVRIKWTCADLRMGAEKGSQKSPMGYAFMTINPEESKCGGMGNKTGCNKNLI